LATLKQEGLDEGLVRKSELLLSRADVVKFSGQEAAQAELEEASTTVETILESHRALVRQKLSNQNEEKTSKWKIHKKKNKQTKEQN